MDSNKHDAMEQMEEDIQMNILIYCTHKTELQMWSYGMMKSAPGCRKNDLEILQSQPRVSRSKSGRARTSRFAGVVAVAGVTRQRRQGRRGRSGRISPDLGADA